ncbi:hypothetical protein [Burkholderia mayonis]|uniref:hypothetical protein n=1 Tax=Burkholderia mayonis TaxID=1385591 RepID=UPI001CF7A2AA|nr:hypothetical protein [Burkholderia mayonis]
MKFAICSAIVLWVLVPLVLPVLLVLPEPLDVLEPCGDLRMLALVVPPESSEPPQAAVIRVTDAQSAAPIKVRVPRESAMVSICLFQ